MSLRQSIWTHSLSLFPLWIGSSHWFFGYGGVVPLLWRFFLNEMNPTVSFDTTNTTLWPHRMLSDPDF